MASVSAAQGDAIAILQAKGARAAAAATATQQSSLSDPRYLTTDLEVLSCSVIN